MKITAWRITKRRYAGSAFTGEGARLYGGRWNSPGTSVVYVAQSQALAVLEGLVHLDFPDLLASYVLLQVDFDSTLIAEIDRAKLPRTWRQDPAPHAVQAIGDSWIASGSSVGLRVPSLLVPGEFNFLLNPRHADFRRLSFFSPVAFKFDSRLTSKR